MTSYRRLYEQEKARADKYRAGVVAVMRETKVVSNYSTPTYSYLYGGHISIPANSNSIDVDLYLQDLKAAQQNDARTARLTPVKEKK